MEQQPQRLPGPAYITLALLLGLAVFIGWSIGSYPEQPAQRAVADSCKTITQPDHRTQQHQTPSYDLVGAEHNAEATGHNDTGDYQNGKSETDRRLADYTCQLAVYTANLAAFTKWLVIATIGLGIVGVWQGANIQRSVQVASRAADEAGDAIRATQAGATAARTSARASQEANRINRDLLIATQRPWISVDLAPTGDLTYRDDGAYLQIRCIMKNLGNTPAIYAWPRVCGVMQGAQNNAARQRELMAEAEQDQSIARQFGHAIFPAQTISVDTAILIKNEEIDAFQRPEFDRKILQITIIGFVKYETTFDRIWRYTGFIHALYRTDVEGITGTGIHPTFYKDAGNIAVEDLTLRPWFADGDCFTAT